MRRKQKNSPPGVIESIRPYAEAVGTKAGPLVGQAAERVGPMVENAGQRLSEAAEASEPYRREAALRGRAAWVTLCGGDPRQVLRQRNRKRRLLVVGGITMLAVGAATAYFLIRTSPPSPWKPEAGDEETTGGRSTESTGAEGPDGSESEWQGSQDARPSTPPQQRSSSNSTSTTT